jgi:hypothetical protein
MNKKTLTVMRGEVKTAAKYFGGLGVLAFFLINIFGSIFLCALPAVGGGNAGEVIDYTLLEKLQQEYGTTTLQDLHQPQISATTTKLDNKEIERAISLKIEESLPAGLVSQSATSTENKIKIGSVIFALIVLMLIVRTYLRNKNNNKPTAN